ncbi:odorant receptor 67c-like isoform X2 [Rhynchophorus ferrugineus]|uniref:odorant receptor 67c-like isoform X2 n=1 Tax=Rhynchophorus ferrugineus TaxID=354439 RepID=UPI003FCD6003
MLNYKKFFKYHHRVIKAAGVWIVDDPINDTYPPFWYGFYRFVVQILCMGLFNLQLLIKWIVNINDIIMFSTLGYVIMTSFMAQIKMILLSRKRLIFISLLKQYDEQLFQPRNENEMELVKINLKKFESIKRSLTYFCYSSLTMSVIAPYFHQEPFGLPFEAWYPIDMSYCLYVAAYIHQTIAITLLAFGFIFGEILVIQSMTFVGLQCDLLCYRLKSIKVKQNSDKENKIILTEYVRNHLMILKFLDITGEMYGMTYLLQLFACTTTFCTGLFLLTVTENSFEYFYLLSYIMAQSFLLLTPCWSATQMTRKSEKIPTAAYSADWIHGTNSFKQMLILIILRSQTPMKFYAGNFFELSLDTYVSICRASYSYFTLLSKMTNEK